MQTIEECGALVDAGLIEREQAIATVRAAAGDGLTPLGAELLLDEWQTARVRIADIGIRAEMGIAACLAAIERGDSRG